MAKPARKKGERDKYGSQIDRIDRRRETWALRAKGLSYRQIAEITGVSRQTAFQDMQVAEKEWGELATDPAQLREGLLALHGQVSGALMESLQQQVENGQVTEYSDNRGGYTKTVRKWPNPQIAAEISRNLARMASLMGLADGAGIDGAGAAQQQTNVVIVSPPSDGGSFEAKYGTGAMVDMPSAAAPAEPVLEVAEEPPAPEPPVEAPAAGQDPNTSYVGRTPIHRRKAS